MASQHPKYRQRDKHDPYLGPPTPPPSPSTIDGSPWRPVSLATLSWIVSCSTAKAAVPGSEPAVRGSRSIMYRPGSPAPATTTILARLFGLGVEWAFAGNWSARAEWDAILLQKAEFYGFRKRIRHRYNHCQQSQHQHVHRRPELQIRRLGVLIRQADGKGTTSRMT